MKRLFGLFLIGACLVWSVFCLSEQTGCGFPGIPQNGKITISYSGTVSRFSYSEISQNESIINAFWPVETRVEYECELSKRYQLFDSKERICQENRTWTGQLSVCDENVAYEKQVEIYDVKERESKLTSLLTDGKTGGKSSGIDLPHFDSKQLILRFNNFFNIRSVVIHGNDEENWEENIRNPTVRRNEEEQDACEISRKSNNSIQWSCPDDGNSTLNLHFFHYSMARYLITEMQVFVRSNITCGYPEISMGVSDFLSYNLSHSATAFYNCSPESELIGSPYRTCRDGIWSGQVPLCKFALSTTTFSYPNLTIEETIKHQPTEQPKHSTNEGQVTSTFPNKDTNDLILNQYGDRTSEIVTTTMKPSSEPFGVQSIIVISVLATALGISVSMLITLFLCKKRRRRKRHVEANASRSVYHSGYEEPLMPIIPITKLDLVPDQIFQTDDHIYEEVANYSEIL